MAVLVGPPEIYQQSAAAAATATSDASVDLISSNLEKTTIHEDKPPMGLTENCSPTFLSTGNPCLDFFFHVVPDTPPEALISRLKLAWDHDPLKALKLVYNLRGVKGTGKSDKEGFYTAALWLYDHHPKTLAANVAAIANFGYFKDSLEILFRVLEGADARKLAQETGDKWKSWKSAKDEWESVNRKLTQEKKDAKTATSRYMRRSYGSTISSLFERRKGLKTTLIESAKTLHSQTREEKRVERAKRVLERFNNDPNFTLLHECVSDLFAQQLQLDMEMLNSGTPNKISLAAKWCPSLDSSFDRITLLCETIAKKVFPRAEYAEYLDVEEAHYAYRVRDRLRKEVLVPLRKALELPEVFIGANDWGSLPYNRVASVAMKNYTSLFVKHDEERFREYLDRVERGDAKIAAGALLPHEIIADFLEDFTSWDGYDDDEDDEDDEEDEDDDDDDKEWKRIVKERRKEKRAAAEEKRAAAQVAELQWKRMLDDMAKIGELKNCLAISDVSGSMHGIPMKVSIALGMLVSELSEEPWKGKVITFSEDPQLHTIEGESLREKTKFVSNMDWGGSTDFQKVFDVILQVAVNGKLKADEMIKRLFVLSDMEFDQASLNPWETDYEAIVRKYREKGYEECVPEIVFWNLRDSRATPVPADQAGVALVSGYSKNLMKIFLEKGGVMDPEAVMDAAIAGKEYQKLVVLD